MRLFPKVNKIQVLPRPKCHASCVGDMRDRRHVYVWHVGGEVWPQKLHGHLENYINQGRLWPSENKTEKQWVFSEKLRKCTCVCASWLSQTLSYSDHSTDCERKRGESRLYFSTLALSSSLLKYKTLLKSEVSTLFGLWATFKRIRSKWSTCIDNAKYFYLYMYWVYFLYTIYVHIHCIIA